MARAKALSRLVGVFGVAVSVAAQGCASLQSTPIQQYVWEMGHNCEHVNSSWQITRVDAEGRYSIRGGNATSSADFEQCMREQVQKHPYKQWLAQGTKPVSATPASRADVPVWKAGDEWQYRWQSPRGSGTYVLAVSREESLDGVAYYVVAAGTTRESYYRTSDFAYFMDKVNGQVELRHTPPSAYLPWPPWPDERIEGTYTSERPLDRRTDQVAVRCESGAPEAVSVPAGTFDAVKITGRNSLTGSVTVERWASVAVKNLVRQRTHLSYGIVERELVAFKLH